MTNPLVPEKPEVKVKVEITAKEAHLLKCLRKCSFGKVIIYKHAGKLIRFESSESIMLTEDKGQDAVRDLL